MADFLSIRLESGGLEKELKAMGANIPAVMARSLNRAGTTGRAVMARHINKDTGIAIGAVKKEIRLDRATRSDPVVRLEIRGRRIPLIAFQARGPEPSRGRGRGVSYRLPSGRGRIRNAFIATMPSGHRGVFIRKTPTRSRRGRPRSSPALPILELFGPSLPYVFEKYIPEFRKAASESLVKNLRSAINFARSKAGLPSAA